MTAKPRRGGSIPATGVNPGHTNLHNSATGTSPAICELFGAQHNTVSMGISSGLKIRLIARSTCPAEHVEQRANSVRGAKGISAMLSGFPD
jgi:hypothetical protein